MLQICTGELAFMLFKGPPSRRFFMLNTHNESGLFPVARAHQFVIKCNANSCNSDQEIEHPSQNLCTCVSNLRPFKWPRRCELPLQWAGPWSLEMSTYGRLSNPSNSGPKYGGPFRVTSVRQNEKMGQGHGSASVKVTPGDRNHVEIRF